MKKINLKNVSLVFLFAVVLIFFYPFWLSGKVPVPADTIIGLYHPYRDLYAPQYPRGIPYKNSLITDPVRQQYPWRSLSIQQFKSFNLPLWNPYNAAGTPLLANFQTAAFYPLNVLFLLPVNFSIVWSFLILLQPLLASIFMFLYLKNLRLNYFSSLLGSIVFAFCGFSIAWMEWGTIGHVALWLPLMLLLTDKIFVRSRSNKISNFKFQISNLKININKFILWNLLYIFSLISSFLAGHLQTFFYLYLVSAVYFLARWQQFGRKLKFLLLYLILNIIFFILTSFQWFQTIQLILLSARDVDQLGLQNEGWFIPAQHLIQFFAPDFFGNPSTGNYWGVWNYAEFVGYIGIFPLLMALFALFYRYDKKTFVFGSIFFISLIFALPNWISRVPFDLQIPFLSTAQPTRLLFLTDFSLAILAALGFDYFIRNGKKYKILFPLGFLALIFSGLWSFVLFTPGIFGLIPPDDLLVSISNLKYPTLILALTAASVLLFIFIGKKRLHTIFIIIFIVITLADLFRFMHKFTPFTDPDYLYPATKTLSFLQENAGNYRVMSADPRILPPNFSIMYVIQTPDIYDPLYLRRYAELIAAMERGEPDISPPFGFNRIINPKNYDSGIADLLGVKYVLSLNEINSPKLLKVFEEGQTKVYENTAGYERVFFIDNILKAENNKQAIDAMFNSSIDLQRTAVVEGYDLANTEFNSVNNKASILTYKNEKVEIRTETTGTSFLVFTDTYYPTWKADICEIDNKNCTGAKIYLTDYNFRGVIVPEGGKLVKFYNTMFGL